MDRVLFCKSIMLFNRRKMEISQKAAEEEERYKKEMEKYTTVFNVLKVTNGYFFV